jgi:hypothetical protein
MWHATRAVALSEQQAQGVLQYWLSALRAEEARASRPRAWKDPQRADVELLEPRRGPEYFRLGAEHAAFFVAPGEGRLRLPLDPARAAFFEHWLRGQYQQQIGRAVGREPRAEAWLAGWPALYFTRREELACLLRFPVEVAWTQGGGAWTPPTYAQRRGNKPLSPPDGVSISSAVEEDAPAFALDTFLLTRSLGMLDEEVDALLRRLVGLRRPGPIVRALLEALAPGEAVPEDDLEVFARLAAVVRGRCGPGVEAYPVGLIYDGSPSFATHHLQQELQALARQEVTTPGGGPLAEYLSGQAVAPGYGLLAGGFRAPGPTADQRQAAELFLGSRLAAAQGPPGCGKTELVLHLCAHELVRRIERVAKKGMGQGILLVTSSNNRAVDNVLDVLAEGELPLGLRVGNREVTAEVTANELARARRWLEAQDDADARPAYEAALKAFQAADARWKALVAPVKAARERAQRVEALRARLARPPAQVDAPPEAREELRGHLVRADGHVRQALLRLEAIEDVMERPKATLAKVKKGFSALKAELLDPLNAVLAKLGEAPVAAELPKEKRWEAWEEVLEQVWSALADHRVQLPRYLSALDDARERAAAEVELAALEGRASAGEVDEAAHRRPEAAPADGARDPEPSARCALEVELFQLALAVRARWAVLERDALVAALTEAEKAARTQRALRRLLEQDGATRRALHQLYPVWGCTLLSLGSTFEPEPGSVARVVIDEAGQCHPAHAVSALLRAERALLVGDVHQLEPVIELNVDDEARLAKKVEARIDAEALGPYRVGEGWRSSAQALADRAVLERPTLRDHFRCQPPIIAISEALCGYGLRVRTPARRVEPLQAPLTFVDVRGQQARARGSWMNAAEAARLLGVLRRLLEQGVRPEDVVVLSPYVGQLELLRREARAYGVRLEDPKGVAAGTVHRFQGGERPVVLFSSVVTEGHRLDFLDARVNLLNVAVSRAKDHLLVFGHRGALAQGARTRRLLEGAAPPEGAPFEGWAPLGGLFEGP